MFCALYYYYLNTLMFILNPNKKQYMFINKQLETGP